jgi:hypothetical protein
VDDENRFYVIQDLNPTGGSAFSTLIAESNLTDVSATALYSDPGILGYFFKGAEMEKFITDSVIFAGHVLTGSYIPETEPTCGPGTAAGAWVPARTLWLPWRPVGSPAPPRYVR